MNKGKVLKFLTASIICASVLGFNIVLPAFAELVHQSNNSPEYRCNILQKQLIKPDNSGLLKTSLQTEQIDQTLKVSFKNSLGSEMALPALGPGEKYFVSLEDVANGKVLDSQYLNSAGIGTVSCSFKVPYYYDRVTIKVYKQKNEDADFTKKDENFIGKARIFMAHESINTIGAETPITELVDEDNMANFVQDLTPNHYKIKLGNYGGSNLIGKIVLPDEQKYLLSEEETIFSSEEVKILDQNKWLFNLYIPAEVTEFNFYIFMENINENNNASLMHYNIKLNRK